MAPYTKNGPKFHPNSTQIGPLVARILRWRWYAAGVMNKKQSVMGEKQRVRSQVAASTEEPLLSPQRAFVLQFYPETDVAQGRVVGRVEQVVSGQTARFDSLEVLVAFLGRVLSAVRAVFPEEK